jgi:hypothetical protein
MTLTQHWGLNGMRTDIVALWGTSVGYTDYGETVGIETNDGRIAIIRKDTFDHLYYRLSEFVAALKEDCIQYAIVSYDKPVCDYPDWFVDACQKMQITQDFGCYIFVDDYGDIAISPDSVVLRNFKGELMHMEYDKFTKYYDTLEVYE